MMAKGSDQASKAPRDVMILILGCSSCALAAAGMLVTETVVPGLVSAVGLGMSIGVVRLARRMRNAWQQRQRQRNAAVQQTDVDRPLLPVEILPAGVSVNRSRNAA